MKKIKKSSELLWLLGIIFVALGVSICSKANLGVSMIAAPAFVLFEALSPIFPFLSVGVTEYVLQGAILIVMCIIVKNFSWRYLLAFAVAVLYGYALDLFLLLLAPITVATIFARWTMLVLGDIITALGVACFFRTYMPLQVYELFVAEFAVYFNKSISRVKTVFDVSLLAVSVTLALTLFGDVLSFNWSTIWYSSFHNIGMGTLVTTAINSLLIALMGKFLDLCFDNSARFKKLEAVLKRN